jgi:hypothetical protein
MYLHIHHVLYNYNHNNSSQNKNKNVYIYIFSCTYINMGCSMLHFYEPAVLKSDGPP